MVITVEMIKDKDHLQRSFTAKKVDGQMIHKVFVYVESDIQKYLMVFFRASLPDNSIKFSFKYGHNNVYYVNNSCNPPVNGSICVELGGSPYFDI